MESALYLIFEMYFWHFWHEQVWLNREWVEKLGKGLAWFYISANNGILGKCIIYLNAEIYCLESVMAISKPIWIEGDTILWNLRSFVRLQTWV